MAIAESFGKSTARQSVLASVMIRRDLVVDSDVLWLNITEEEVKRNYERNVAPDPYRYYFKDYPYYAEDYPPLLIIPQRYKPPEYAPRQDTKKVYKCDICNQQFPSRDEFSGHVKSMH